MSEGKVKDRMEESSPPRRRRWLIAIAAGTAVGLAVYLTTRARQSPPEQAGTPSPTSADRPQAQPPDPAAVAWERYKRLEHPYIDFLDAVKHGRVADSRTYEEWREGLPNARFQDRDKPLPEALRRQVEERRRPAPAFKEAARQMAALLRQWSGKPEPSEQATDRPFPVIDQFFRYLVRPGTLPRPSEMDHPAIVFLWRLPRDPVAEGRTFDSEEDLKLPLCLLLRDLEGNPAAPLHLTLSTREILEHISGQLDYKSWLAGRRFALRAEEDTGPEVREALARFQGKNP
jgi:hypothetical protein